MTLALCKRVDDTWLAQLPNASMQLTRRRVAPVRLLLSSARSLPAAWSVYRDCMPREEAAINLPAQCVYIQAVSGAEVRTGNYMERAL